MYPYQPPQIAALANRYNPQPMGAPIMSQAPPTTSGQIQPSGLQPQASPAMNGLMDRFNLRPQVAALAQQYNPQFTPQMFGGDPNAQMPPGFAQQNAQVFNQQMMQQNLAKQMQSLPPGIDPAAVAANPQAYQQWVIAKQ